ncbi:CCR4-NOT transcription complex subunit 4 [Nematocida homosporus]|uniref:CCR4-NOT transcription complex subunit 4 n=1 Tax=Nematocida homosporus TaxID=1912981 RepID=UPI0022202798|nr:CCR4-NOT transcription complex subunit 4 [Nematocida homosporus]KAI5187029.1 CCR4-NOT transcription complex subunit 4 [Nematocida homosporus]
MQLETMERRVGDKEDLQNIRVLQRNLVYAVGIPAEFAREEILCSRSLFGGFGEIVKVVLSRRLSNSGGNSNSNSSNSSGSSSSSSGNRVSSNSSSNRVGGSKEEMFSAYITYLKEECAAEAIREMDSFRLGDRIVRCTFGTTKYCSFFLRGIKCSNDGCLYLHEKGRVEDSFARDQMSVLKTKIEKIIEVKGKGKDSMGGVGSSSMGESSSGVVGGSGLSSGSGSGGLEEIEELSELFLFKPDRVVRQRHYESCHFNPFYRRGREEAYEQKVKSICAEK